MSKLLQSLLKEQKSLKESGWKPRFRGDTGMNVCQVMIDNNIEARNEWDTAFVDTFKEIKIRTIGNSQTQMRFKHNCKNIYDN